jgi:hypothetical protein
VVDWKDSVRIYHRKRSFRWLMNSRPVRLNHRKSEFPAKIAFSKNQFSQPWNICFARSNNRSTSTDHRLSNGTIRFGFGAREDSQNFPTRLGIFPSKMLVRFLELTFGSNWDGYLPARCSRT